MQPEHESRFSKEDLKKLRHPSESSRLILALIVGWPVVLSAAAFTVRTYGLTLVLFGLIVLVYWFGVEWARAHLMGHSLRADSSTFPEITSYVERTRERLGVEKDIEVFVIEDGPINAYLAKFFGSQYIILTSAMIGDLDDVRTRKQVEFVLARFIGAIAAKHSRATIPRVLFSSVEKLKIFNFFMWPYERATQYSGDQIGLAVVGDLEAAVNAMYRFMVGDHLYDRVALSTVAAQARRVDGIMGVLARIFSPFPHMVHRVQNLVAFAQAEMPDQHSLLFTGVRVATSKSAEAPAWTNQPGAAARGAVDNDAVGEATRGAPAEDGPEQVAVPATEMDEPDVLGGAPTDANGQTVSPLLTDTSLGLGSPTLGHRIAAFAAVAWLGSWLLPAAYGGNQLYSGWEAFWAGLALTREAVAGGTLIAPGVVGLSLWLSPLSNFVLALGFISFLVFRRGKRVGWIAALLVAVSLTNVVWIGFDDIDALLAGYWFWLIGSLVVPAGMVVALVTKPPTQAEEGPATPPEPGFGWNRGLATGLAVFAGLVLISGFQAHRPRVTGLEVFSGNDQLAEVSSPVAQSPEVRVVDQFGRPHRNVEVDFQVTAGAGAIERPRTITDSRGVASPGSWTLGEAIEENVLVARVPGLTPLRFTASATPDAAMRAAVMALEAERTDSIASADQGTVVGMAFSQAHPEGSYGNAPTRVRFQISRAPSQSAQSAANGPAWDASMIATAESPLHLLTRGYRRVELSPGSSINLKIEFIDRDEWGGVQVRGGFGGTLSVRSNGDEAWQTLTAGGQTQRRWAPYDNNRSYRIRMRNGGVAGSTLGPVYLDYRFAIEAAGAP